MDSNLHITWPKRVRNLRIAIRYTRIKFARVLGVADPVVRRLESGLTKPTIRMIRRLRLMEKAFAEPLEQYYKDVKKFHQNWTWGKEVKIYDKYEGDLYRKLAIGYKSSDLLPIRKSDIEALGGMEVFGYNRSKARQKDIRGGESSGVGGEIENGSR